MAPAKKLEISNTLFEVAHQRTALMERRAFRESPQAMLTAAYVQGMIDAIETLDRLKKLGASNVRS